MATYFKSRMTFPSSLETNLLIRIHLAKKCGRFFKNPNPPYLDKCDFLDWKRNFHSNSGWPRWAKFMSRNWKWIPQKITLFAQSTLSRVPQISFSNLGAANASNLNNSLTFLVVWPKLHASPILNLLRLVNYFYLQSLTIRMLRRRTES